MSASRKFSVQRHVRQLHAGEGFVIPFIEYLAGRKGGKYFPKSISHSPNSHDHILKLISSEVEKDFARKVANKVNKAADHPDYEQVASIVRQYKLNKYLKEMWKDLKTGV